MDEILGITQKQFAEPLPIPPESFVLRQANKTILDKEGRYPKAKHFIPDEDGLSVHWDNFITVEEVFHIIGLSYKFAKEEFKDPCQFHIFKFPVHFLLLIEGIAQVIHSPVFNGNPAPVGMPNNYAHSSICYGQDEEIRLKLSAYCNEEHEVAYCKVQDFELLEKEVEALRLRLNETKYHRCLLDNESIPIVE